MTEPPTGMKRVERVVVHEGTYTQIELNYRPQASVYSPMDDVRPPTFAGVPGSRRRRDDRKRQRRNRRGGGR